MWKAPRDLRLSGGLPHAPILAGMGILKDFFQAMRQTKCDGCGRELTVCDRACREAAAVERDWQDSIK